jgi:hypothetical protein
VLIYLLDSLWEEILTHALQLEHVTDVRTAVEAMFASQPTKSRKPHIDIAGTKKTT